MDNRRVVNPHRTNPFIWCFAILCAVVTFVVIITGIVVIIGYSVIKPKVPYISVTSAQLDRLDYDQIGLLSVRIVVVINAVNENIHAHASFYNTNIILGFDGLRIAYLRAAPIEVEKNNTIELRYEVESKPITLEPHEQESLELQLKENLISFVLKGTTRTRWRVGLLGSVKFSLQLDCLLQLPRTGEVVYPRCKTNSK